VEFTNVQLKHEKSNSMSIVLHANPNCIDTKQQLFSDLEILNLPKYTTQTCNSTFGNKKIVSCELLQKFRLTLAYRTWKKPQCPIFAWITMEMYEDKIIMGNRFTLWFFPPNCEINIAFWKALKNIHTTLDIFVDFHMISALHIGLR